MSKSNSTITVSELKALAESARGSKIMPRFPKSATPGRRDNETSPINVLNTGVGAEGLSDRLALVEGNLVINIGGIVDDMVDAKVFQAIEVDEDTTVRVSVAKRGGAREELVAHYLLMQRISWTNACKRAGIDVTVNAVGDMLVIRPQNLVVSEAERLAGLAELAA